MPELRSQLPVVIATSVVRSSQQGESHGGAYLVDLASGRWKQVLDWNDGSINWEGRGKDRGLRGMAVFDGNVILAASDEIFFFRPDFSLLASYRNRYLKHCHEITVGGERAYFTSTGFDSILEFDLSTRRFVSGFHIRASTFERCIRRSPLPYRPKLRVFDPESPDGPSLGDTQHLNSVWVERGTLFTSGTRLRYLLAITSEHRLDRFARIPQGTHNARPWGDGVLINATDHDSTCLLRRNGTVVSRFPVIDYPRAQLLNGDIPGDHARPGFARGLAVHQGVIVVGSSPATITAWDMDSGRQLTSVTLTMDVRHAIHGLEVWPFAAPWTRTAAAEHATPDRAVAQQIEGHGA